MTTKNLFIFMYIFLDILLFLQIILKLKLCVKKYPSFASKEPVKRHSYKPNFERKLDTIK